MTTGGFKRIGEYFHTLIILLNEGLIKIGESVALDLKNLNSHYPYKIKSRVIFDSALFIYPFQLIYITLTVQSWYQ